MADYKFGSWIIMVYYDIFERLATQIPMSHIWQLMALDTREEGSVLSEVCDFRASC